VQAHAADLRAEIEDVSEEERERLVAAISTDWRAADLAPADAALCAYAVQLTDAPASMREDDVRGLRAHDFDDVAIHDAVQVVSYFNYINRVADAIHVDLEPEMPPYPDCGSG